PMTAAAAAAGGAAQAAAQVAQTSTDPTHAKAASDAAAAATQAAQAATQAANAASQAANAATAAAAANVQATSVPTIVPSSAPTAAPGGTPSMAPWTGTTAQAPVPANLPPFPGPGWTPDTPVSSAIANRATYWNPQLWNFGSKVIVKPFVQEQFGGRWLTFVAAWHPGDKGPQTFMATECWRLASSLPVADPASVTPQNAPV